MVKDPYRFYTYAYLREDRTPYYIGKGVGSRAYKKYKNKIKPPKDKTRIIFLKQNLLEEEAFKHEKYMIAVFGRKDLGTGILHNRTDGGECSSGRICSEETKVKIGTAQKGDKNHSYGKSLSEEHKKKLSEAGKNKVFSEETRKKLSEKNKGRTLSEETKRKISQSREGNVPWNKGKKGLQKHSQEAKERIRESHKGKKWWNDGINNKFCKECPDNGWTSGIIRH